MEKFYSRKITNKNTFSLCVDLFKKKGEKRGKKMKILYKASKSKQILLFRSNCKPHILTDEFVNVSNCLTLHRYYKFLMCCKKKKEPQKPAFRFYCIRMPIFFLNTPKNTP